MLSDSTLQQIREATNIVDIVAEHVRLRKRGKNWLGLCPFHNEKTPSFNVLEDRGIFKCFGCGKGGDVFSFVMAIEGLTFPEAAERLAEKAHIEVASERSDEAEQARSERENIYEALRAAVTFYRGKLSSPAGSVARDYLSKRGMDEETQRVFGVGFAPEQSGLLIDELQRKGYALPLLEAAGLVAHSDKGDIYERFRGRVMFPVVSQTGRVVGFGGRILPGAPDRFAKYVNSPESIVYHKSKILYGLFQAKDEIRRQEFAVLVEGYADVLSVYQASVKNVVAASGTSLTSEQLNLLKKYCSEVVLLFDADAAGQRAVIRGIDMAIEAGFDVYGVPMPPGEDPDSYIRLRGAEVFRSALKQRVLWVEMRARWFEEQGFLDDPVKKADAAQEILATIAKIPNSLKRGEITDLLALRFKSLQRLLHSELQKYLTPTFTEKEQHSSSDTRRQSSQISNEAPSENAPPAESSLLEAALLDPVAVGLLINDSTFDLDLITNHLIREVIGRLAQDIYEGEQYRTFEQLLDIYRDTPEHALLLKYGVNDQAFKRELGEGNDENAWITTKAQQAMTLIELASLEKQQRVIMDELRQEKSVDGVTRIQEELLNLSQQIQALKQKTY
jgi:DNA primase